MTGPSTTSNDEQGTPTVGRAHLAKGLGTTLLARMGALVEVVAQPLYVAMFGLAGYGVYAVLWAAINLIENIFDLGMTSAMQRTVPQSADDSEAVAALRAALLFGVSPCLVVAAVIWALAGTIAPVLNVAPRDLALVAPSIQLFIWALPLWAFVEIATSALRARHLFGAEIRLRIVWEQLIRLALAAVFFVMGLGLFGLFLAHILSLTITAALTLRLLSRHYPLHLLFARPFAPPVFAQTFWAGLSILPSNIVARLFGDGPALILNMLLPGAAGASAAGLFTIARKISSVVQLVRIAFVYVLAPLASSAERADRTQVRDIYAYAVRLILTIALPVALVLSAGADAILSVFGPAAGAAEAALIILLVARAGEAVLGISLPVLQVIAAFRHQLAAGLIGLAAAVALGWALLGAGWFTPLTSVALAVAAGSLIAAIIPMVQLRVYEGLSPADHQLARVTLRSAAIALAGMVLALFARLLPDAAAIVLTLLIGLAATWCALRFALPYSDRESLGKVARRLRLIAPDAAPSKA
jgi:O-antigen/teichoic acid export membrane protein